MKWATTITKKIRLTFNVHFLFDLLALPEELILQVLSYLTVNDLLTLSLVCQTLNQLSNDNILWRPFFSIYTTRHAPALQHGFFKKHCRQARCLDEIEHLLNAPCTELIDTEEFIRIKKLSEFVKANGWQALYTNDSREAFTYLETSIDLALPYTTSLLLRHNPFHNESYNAGLYHAAIVALDWATAQPHSLSDRELEQAPIMKIIHLLLMFDARITRHLRSLLSHPNDIGPVKQHNFYSMVKLLRKLGLYEFSQKQDDHAIAFMESLEHAPHRCFVS